MTSAKSTFKNRLNLPDAPHHKKRAIKRKRFGIEHQSRWSGEWVCHNWYATRKARDEAFKNLTTKTDILRGTKWDTPKRKVDR